MRRTIAAAVAGVVALAVLVGGREAAARTACTPGPIKVDRDGTYVGGVLSLNYGNKGYLVRGDTLKITLQRNRSRGTFSGESVLVSPAVNVTGSFSC